MYNNTYILNIYIHFINIKYILYIIIHIIIYLEHGKKETIINCRVSFVREVAQTLKEN